MKLRVRRNPSSLLGLPLALFLAIPSRHCAQRFSSSGIRRLASGRVRRRRIRRPRNILLVRRHTHTIFFAQNVRPPQIFIGVNVCFRVRCRLRLFRLARFFLTRRRGNILRGILCSSGNPGEQTKPQHARADARYARTQRASPDHKIATHHYSSTYANPVREAAPGTPELTGSLNGYCRDSSSPDGKVAVPVPEQQQDKKTETSGHTRYVAAFYI